MVCSSLSILSLARHLADLPSFTLVCLSQSLVNIRNIELLNNPARFDDPYNFRIKFEAIAPLAEDIEWRLIYVGSATSEEYDQELDSCMVGPIPAGINAFDFAAPAPAHDLLPSTASEEILGVTVIIITASYRDKEFVRVGYYVNTYSEDPAYQQEQLPPTVEWDKLMRNVLIEKPKVTRFQNPWDSNPNPSPFDAPLQQHQPQYDEIPSAGSNYMLDNAPLPPPVQKAASAFPPPQRGIPNGGMDVDYSMVT